MFVSIPEPIIAKIKVLNESCMEYTLRPPAQTTNLQNSKLVVFVNGLRTSMKDWKGLTAELAYRYPSIYSLTFDRWGVGTSDAIPPSRSGRNDLATASEDFGLLLKAVLIKHDDIICPAKMRLVLIGSSIGCSIIRYFLENYSTGIPGVEAVLMLDSYLANTDFLSLFPEKCDEEPEPLTRTRDIIMKIFGPEIKNKEGFDRTNTACLLPCAKTPRLTGNPYLVVIVHDSEYMVSEMVKSMGVDKNWYLLCVDSAVMKYHEDMLQGLSDRGKWVVAENAGHFIHADRMDLVIDETIKALDIIAVR